MAAEHTARMGARIAKLREERQMSQRELADLLPGKTDGNQISKWERGVHRPGDDALEQIAKALEVDPSYFLVPGPLPNTGDLIGALDNRRSEQIDGGRSLVDVHAKLDAIMVHLGISLSSDPGEEESSIEQVLTDAEANAGTRSDSSAPKRPVRRTGGR